MAILAAMTIFARTLGTAAMEEVFSDQAVIAAMLVFEAALAEAEAEAGVIPASAAAPIVAACGGAFEAEPLVEAGRRAGSLAIPLVAELTARVAAVDPKAAAYVHRGSTSQDVIDSANAIVTGRALDLIDTELGRLIASLQDLAQRHIDAPMLARTLLQPAQVISFGFKLVAWLAPLVRARSRLRQARQEALQLQLGGAVGTLGLLGDAGADVATRVAAKLGLGAPAGAWHTQRDAWVSLGCEVAVLCGSLGKIGTDIALLAQAEVGEVSEPTAPGRGSSSAMPNKRNPVAAMVARSAAIRAPQHAAALLAAMSQEHERGLGGWQAELAEWPPLFIATHGAATALADAMAGLVVDTARMRGNIEAQFGTVFAEGAAALLAGSLGKAGAQALVGRLSALAANGKGELHALLGAELETDAALASIDRPALAAVFDIDRAAQQAAASARLQLAAIARDAATLAA